MEKQGNKIVVKFKDVGEGLHCVDSKDVEGFAIAGADKKFVWAKAVIVPPKDGGKADTIEVSSKEVPDPVAVRYAWADNPVCNLYNNVLLPVTPFRTDDWKGKTEGVNVTPTIAIAVGWVELRETHHFDFALFRTPVREQPLVHLRVVVRLRPRIVLRLRINR